MHSAPDVVTNAGVSRKTFYEHFNSREDCQLAAYDAASEALWRAEEEEEASSASEWPARVRVPNPPTAAAFLGSLP